MTYDERKAIKALPESVFALNPWQNTAWNVIIRRYSPVCSTYAATRHRALEHNDTYCQARLLELIRDAAKLRLTA